MAGSAKKALGVDSGWGLHSWNSERTKGVGVEVGKTGDAGECG